MRSRDGYSGQILTRRPAERVPKAGDERSAVEERALDLARPLRHWHATAREKLELRPLRVDRRLPWDRSRLGDLEARVRLEGSAGHERHRGIDVAKNTRTGELSPRPMPASGEVGEPGVGTKLAMADEVTAVGERGDEGIEDREGRRGGGVPGSGKTSM